MEKNQFTYPLAGFSLEETLFCGQSFTWQKTEDGGYMGVAENKAVLASYDGNYLTIQNLLPRPFTSEDDLFWQYYFALDIDYTALKALFSQHPPLDECIAFSPGIRVLRQPFFETVLSFIISQNNHIPRITGIVQRLREHFGPQLAPGLFAFPAPEVLAALEPDDLAPLRAGFRAKYMIDAAKKIAEGTVNEKILQSLSDQEARAHLKQIYGVGDKVADCVLLFSQGRFNTVPMDVWMKRALAAFFPSGYPDEVLPYGGIAQQFTFNWARAHLNEKAKNN